MQVWEDKGKQDRREVWTQVMEECAHGAEESKSYIVSNEAAQSFSREIQNDENIVSGRSYGHPLRMQKESSLIIMGPHHRKPPALWKHVQESNRSCSQSFPLPLSSSMQSDFKRCSLARPSTIKIF